MWMGWSTTWSATIDNLNIIDTSTNNGNIETQNHSLAWVKSS